MNASSKLVVVIAAGGTAGHIRPALAVGEALRARGATLTFAGSLQGVTRTLPLEIYLQRESDADAAVALSLVLVVVAVLIVLATRGRAGEGSW